MTEQYLRASRLLNNDKCNTACLPAFEVALKQFLKSYVDYEKLDIRLDKQQHGFTIDIDVYATAFKNVTIIL